MLPAQTSRSSSMGAPQCSFIEPAVHRLRRIFKSRVTASRKNLTFAKIENNDVKHAVRQSVCITYEVAIWKTRYHIRWLSNCSVACHVNWVWSPQRLGFG